MSWWWHLTGPNGHLGWFFSVTGRWYGFWSGLGITAFGPFAYWHHTNCHTDGCKRIGRRIQVDQDGHQIRRCVKCLRSLTTGKTSS